MKKFQFSVCVILDDGFVMPVVNLITPPVIAESYDVALADPNLVKFCEDNKVHIFQEVER